jgi:hypothetical protein
MVGSRVGRYVLLCMYAGWQTSRQADKRTSKQASLGEGPGRDMVGTVPGVKGGPEEQQKGKQTACAALRAMDLLWLVGDPSSSGTNLPYACLCVCACVGSRAGERN